MQGVSLLIDKTYLLCSTIKRNSRLRWVLNFKRSLNSLAPKLVCPSSGILSVQKRHQGLNFQRSYKSLKTAVILRPELTNFFTVKGAYCN